MKNTCNASVEPFGLLQVQSHERREALWGKLPPESFALKDTWRWIRWGFRSLAKEAHLWEASPDRLPHCTKANVSDDQGLIEMLKGNIDYFKSKPVNIPKITILLDNGYHPEKLEEQLKKVYPQIMNKIKFKLSLKPSIEQKQKVGKTGFVPVQARWVIERSNSWMERCKSKAQEL